MFSGSLSIHSPQLHASLPLILVCFFWKTCNDSPPALHDQRMTMIMMMVKRVTDLTDEGSSEDTV